MNAASCPINNILRKFNHFSARSLQTIINIHQCRNFHIHTGKHNGKRIKLLIRTCKLQMFNNTVFCTDDKFFCIGFFCIIYTACCRTYIISLLNYFLTAFRMNKKECLRMCFSSFFDIFCADNNMSRTSTFIEDKGFLRKFFCYKSSKIRIRNKQNLIILNLTAYLNCRRRRHTNITFCFQLGSRVDIRHNRMIRMLCLQFAESLKIKLLCHRASR